MSQFGTNFHNILLSHPKEQSPLGNGFIGEASLLRQDLPEAYINLPDIAKKLLQLSVENLKIPEIQDYLWRAQAHTKINFFDMDHTMYNAGVPLTEEKILDYMKYNHLERQNIDLSLIQALLGNPFVVETGKEANIYPVATYMTRRLLYLAEFFGMTEEHRRDKHRFSDGRMRSIDGTKTVILGFSTANGGITYELTAPNASEAIIVLKPIPLDAWERMQLDEELLFASSQEDRIRQITGRELDGSAITENHRFDETGKLIPRTIHLGGGDMLETTRMPARIPYSAPHDGKTLFSRTRQQHITDKSHIYKPDQLRREVSPELTNRESELRTKLTASMRDFMMISPWFVKANLVFKLPKILDDTELNDAWFRRTGVRIQGDTSTKQRAKLFEACQVLARDWGVNVANAYAGGTFYLDIGANGINKRINARLVKKFAQSINAFNALNDLDIPINLETVTHFIENPLHKMVSLKTGDGGKNSNDGPLMKSPGAATVSTHSDEEAFDENDAPIPLHAIFGSHSNIQLANNHLVFQILAQEYQSLEIRDHVLDTLLRLSATEWRQE